MTTVWQGLTPGVAAHGSAQQAAKRTVDLVIALICLLLALPIVFAAGVAIVIDSPGGMFFSQRRLGRNGRPFMVLKLRTMTKGAEHQGAGLYCENDDPRYTRVGKWLRRWSLDELPQVLNVLRGDMSIVGPRPLPAAVVDQYPTEYDVILQAKPGITGLSQVSGRNDLVRSRRLELDQRYARTWTLAMDFAILARTVGVVLSGSGQRNDQSREDVEQ